MEPKETAPLWKPPPIQKAIDAARKMGIVTLKPGTYLTGSLFLKSGVTLDVPEAPRLSARRNWRTTRASHAHRRH